MSHAFQDTLGWDNNSCLEQAEMATCDGERREVILQFYSCNVK